MRVHFTDFHAFAERFSTGYGPDALDDFDVTSITMLRGAEREEAIAVLCERLDDSAEDPRVPRALWLLNAEQAIPHLRCRAARATGYTDIAAAVALFRMADDSQAVSALVRTLRDSSDKDGREQAAIALASIPPGNDGVGAEVLAALIDAIGDRAEGVRAAAFEALVTRLNIRYLGPRTRFGRLEGRLFINLPTVKKATVAALKGNFRSIAAGKGPVEPDLFVERAPDSPDLITFRRSVFGHELTRTVPPVDVDLDAFRELSGEERRWGEQFILQLLSDGDERGIRAAATLGEDWVIAALAELAKRKRGTGPAARQALAGLGRSSTFEA